MGNKTRTWAMLACVALLLTACGVIPGRTLDGATLRVVSDTTIKGFVFPESVGCDAANQTLYVSQFGGTEPRSGDKDSKGFISKVALDGKMIEERFLPVAGEVLHKPKGIWIEGERLWVTDIDVMWVFDTRTRKGRKLEVPGAKFLNDPAVSGGALYVSDNRADQLFRIEPADFLAAGVQPKVTTVWAGKAINPNGLYPSRDGSLLMVGLLNAEQPRGIYSMGKGDAITALSQPLGRLDGLYEMRDGTILATDWGTGSVFRWNAQRGMEPLATGFKGPADFCVIPQGDGLTVFVPDLVQSQVRILRLER